MVKSIYIPDDMYLRLESRAKAKGFATADDYVGEILKQVIVKLENEGNKKSYSLEEEEQIKNRLKKLGYLG